jgi:hypothetical protein
MSDLADHPDFSAHPTSGSTEVTRDLVLDFLNTALLVVASTSIANHSATHGLTNGNTSLVISYLPPRLRGKPVTCSSVKPISNELREQLRYLSETLDLVCELSRLIASATAYVPDLAVFAFSWQQAASRTLAVLPHLQRELGSDLTEDLQANIRLAGTLLAAVCRGSWPCLSEDGRIVLPLPVERRENVRVQSGRYVFFEVNGSIQRTLAENVSNCGLGVLGLVGAEPGTPTTLMLGPGSCVHGQIVWVQGKQAGIRFDRPLPEPLIDALVN